MPRPNKIIQLGLQDKVLKLRNKGKSYNDIVITLRKENNVKISNMAVKRFLDGFQDKVNEQAVEVIKEDKRRIVKSVNQNYDIIQTQLDISKRVLLKLDAIEDVDGVIKKVTESAKILMNSGMNITSMDFAAQIARQISDNIKDFTTLTREVRENNKFLADLQEKIYDFTLLQEFVSLFIKEFKKEDPQTTLKVLKRLKTNRRIVKIIESCGGDE